MIIKRNVGFYARVAKSGNISVRMLVTYKGNKVEFQTGIVVLKDGWDAKTRRIKSRYKENDVFVAPKYNNVLNSYVGFIDEIFTKYELVEKRVPEKDELRNEFFFKTGKSVKKKNNKNSFFDAFDEFVRTESVLKCWSVKTISRINTARKHLQEFNGNLAFDRITEDVLQEYIDYHYKKGYKNSTIEKEHKILRWFLKWAKKKGYYNYTLYFTPKFKGGNTKEIIYLTIEELEKLKRYTSDKQHLLASRDILLFCCYTGLRYSDIAKLTRADIKDDMIKVVMQKTTNPVYVNLNKNSLAILNKYDGCDSIFPKIGNQELNNHLKIVGQECGIDSPQKIVYFKGNNRIEETFPKYKLLTTHCGRRTFVITALQLGIHESVIMKWTGHSTFASMKPYHKIVDKIKETEMKKFDKIFGENSGDII